MKYFTRFECWPFYQALLKDGKAKTFCKSCRTVQEYVVEHTETRVQLSCPACGCRTDTADSLLQAVLHWMLGNCVYPEEEVQNADS
jgi:hypothetical protein